MPARNEEGCIADTASRFASALSEAAIPFEIVVVDDGSTDGTGAEILDLARRKTEVRLVRKAGPNGFGLAIRKGLESVTGDAVFIVMADGSDSPADLLRYHRKLLEGYDCVFGSRFVRGAKVIDYPWHKLIIN